MRRVNQPRILFVATIFSPIAARWISQLADTGWDVHVFGTHNTIHKLFTNVTFHVIGRVEKSSHCTVVNHDLWPRFRGRGRIIRHFPKVARRLRLDIDPIDVLVNLIRRLEPDCIHALKMQDEAYFVSEALQRLSRKDIPFIYSVWGSDINLYKQFPEHLTRIQRVLPTVNYLMADNPRDIALAIENGFKGEVLGVFPGGGGYPIQKMQSYIQTPPSRRRVIAVKGYQIDISGQVLTALEAIKHCGSIFDGYRIVIHSAIGTYGAGNFDEVKRTAEEVSRACNVPIEFLPYSPPEKIWELFSQARMAIAISKSDGTPNAMLEAMTVGSFPIQSNTGGLEAWIDSGTNGYLVPFDSIQHISEAILRVLKDDELVDNAANLNCRSTKERLDEASVRDHVISAYNLVLSKHNAALETKL